MAVAHHHEREVTYDVDPGWAVPDLGELVSTGGHLRTATHRLSAVYYDTAPALLRPLGITLRHRDGGPDAGWHLKIPARDGRTEVHSRARGASVPVALTRRVAGIVGHRRLAPVATIDTTRHTVQLLDVDGELVVEVADDHVVGARTGDDCEPVTWREVEIELGPVGRERDLAAVATVCERAGARPASQERKINHVLGEPPDAEVGGRGGLVATYLREQCRAVLVGDARLRDEATPDPVHRTRVAVRRLRATLRLFPHVLALSAPERDRVDGELRWLGGLLSPVRDADVLGVRLMSELDRVPRSDVVGPVRDEVRRTLSGDREAALATWRVARDSERYRLLLGTLTTWFLTSPVVDGAPVRPRRVLRQAERAVQRRLARSHDSAGLHRARKAAKRLRYAAEALTPGVGRAGSAARRAKRRQSRWGEHQDLAVAADFLRRRSDLAATPPVRSGFTYGVLVNRLERKAARIRRTAGLSP